MRKFQKIQLWLCFIPGLSTLFITFATMFILKKYHASFLYWFLFVVVFLGGGIMASILPSMVLLSNIELLKYLFTVCVFTGMNALLVEIQNKCISHSI